MLEKIISGGQTGVDSAALDTALALDFDFGGWCPKGRINENGLLPLQYSKLREIDGDYACDKENYDTRTRMNIRDSDATLILLPSLPIPESIKDGTLLTIEETQKQHKPYFMMSLTDANEANIELFKTWFLENDIFVLNIAGPRESSWDGIHDMAYHFLMTIVPQLIQQKNFAPT